MATQVLTLVMAIDKTQRLACALLVRMIQDILYDDFDNMQLFATLAKTVYTDSDDGVHALEKWLQIKKSMEEAQQMAEDTLEEELHK